MSTEKDESYTVVVKGKALASIKVSEQLFCPPSLFSLLFSFALHSFLFSISSKADLIHAFLSVADLQHSVLSPVSFRLEYKRGSTAPAMFQRQVTEN